MRLRFCLPRLWFLPPFCRCLPLSAVLCHHAAFCRFAFTCCSAAAGSAVQDCLPALVLPTCHLHIPRSTAFCLLPAFLRVPPAAPAGFCAGLLCLPSACRFTPHRDTACLRINATCRITLPPQITAWFCGCGFCLQFSAFAPPPGFLRFCRLLRAPAWIGAACVLHAVKNCTVAAVGCLLDCRSASEHLAAPPAVLPAGPAVTSFSLLLWVPACRYLPLPGSCRCRLRNTSLRYCTCTLPARFRLRNTSAFSLPASAFLNMPPAVDCIPLPRLRLPLPLHHILCLPAVLDSYRAVTTAFLPACRLLPGSAPPALRVFCVLLPRLLVLHGFCLPLDFLPCLCHLVSAPLQINADSFCSYRFLPPFHLPLRNGVLPPRCLPLPLPARLVSPAGLYHLPLPCLLPFSSSPRKRFTAVWVAASAPPPAAVCVAITAFHFAPCCIPACCLPQGGRHCLPRLPRTCPFSGWNSAACRFCWVWVRCRSAFACLLLCRLPACSPRLACLPASQVRIFCRFGFACCCLPPDLSPAVCLPAAACAWTLRCGLLLPVCSYMGGCGSAFCHLRAPAVLRFRYLRRSRRRSAPPHTVISCVPLSPPFVLHRSATVSACRSAACRFVSGSTVLPFVLHRSALPGFPALGSVRFSPPAACSWISPPPPHTPACLPAPAVFVRCAAPPPLPAVSFWMPFPFLPLQCWFPAWILPPFCVSRSPAAVCSSAAVPVACV